MDKKITSIVDSVFTKLGNAVCNIDKDELIKYVLSKKTNYINNGNTSFRNYFSIVTKKGIIVLLDKDKDRIRKMEMRDSKINQILNG